MSGHNSSARRRAVLALLGRIIPGAPAAPPPAPQFTDSDWALSRSAREAVDTFAHVARWRVTLIPADHVTRHFYMRGTLESVTNRAHSIFTEPGLVLVEPAPVQIGPESFDKRLSLSR
jgi:hypothetical protein